MRHMSYSADSSFDGRRKSAKIGKCLCITGFTLIELIAIMVVIGVLAIAAIPRLGGTTAFEARGFADVAVSMIRSAQKNAVAKRRYVCLDITGNKNIIISLDPNEADNGHVPNCSSSMAGPTGKSPYSETAPSGVTITNAALIFLPSGALNGGGDAAITVAAGSEPNRLITVVGQTGHVFTNY
jgi:MSHA pilin protein MshC